MTSSVSAAGWTPRLRAPRAGLRRQSPSAPPTAEALTRFVCPAFAVGVRLEQDGTLHVAAPFGLTDLFDLRLRVNPQRGVPADWSRIVGGVVARWPELTVQGPPLDAT